MTGTIQDVPTLTGSISEVPMIFGTLSATGEMKGTVDVLEYYPEYKGEYLVTPKASDAVTLNTANMVLKEDVVVAKVPYYETSNETGTTVYIAKEVE